MAQVSRRKIKKSVWNGMWSKLIYAVKIHSKDEEIESLVSGLLTATERVMLAKRLMVSVLLLSGWSVPAIADELKLGTATVYKYKALFELDSGYRRVLRKSFPARIEKRKQGEKSNAFLEFLEDVLAGRTNRSRMYYGKNPEYD